MARALILVDLQNDFMPGGALAVSDGDAVVAVANHLMPSYDIVVATQDWHPADHGSFATSHDGRQAYEVVDLNGLDQVLWPVHCVADTDGAAFHDELMVEHITNVFTKGTDTGIDSYSGFFDNGRRQATGLGDWLQEQTVTAVDILGLATDYCVKFTTLDAIDLGFATRLIVPGCRAVDLNPGDGDAAIATMQAAGAVIVTTVDQETTQ